MSPTVPTSASPTPDSAAAWCNLSEALREQACPAEAIAAARRALELEPTSVLAQISMARAQISAGHIDAATAGLRDITRQNPTNADAWWLLADLKTARFDSADVARLNEALGQPDLAPRSRVLLGFTLGHALEDQADYVRAFDTLSAANALQRRSATWNAIAEHKRIEAIQRIFSGPMETAAEPAFGREVIFIASLPRSGSTLVEQILASHRDVAGANEMTCLKDLVTREAMRQRRPFPLWIPATKAGEWHQLGTEYLACAAQWHQGKARFTDKNLLNWMFAGTALTMLPAARVVIVRRDPVETCLACFRQWFDQGSQFSCDLDDMADRYADFWRLSRFWLQRYPASVLDLEYETLVTAPEAAIRRLLDFCGLPFDPACLQFHHTQRPVLSGPSAAQVREPLRRDTRRAARYGERLDALRARLRAAGVPVT